DDGMCGGDRTLRRFDLEPRAGAIDARNLATECERQSLRVRTARGAVAFSHAPVDLGVAIALEVAHRDQLRLGAGDIGRDRTDQRIPAIARLEAIRRRTVRMLPPHLVDTLEKCA